MSVSTRSGIALTFVTVSIIFLLITVHTARKHLVVEDYVQTLHTSLRTYTHHARVLTNTEINDVIQSNPLLVNVLRSLVEVEVNRSKTSQLFDSRRSFGLPTEEPITDEPDLLIDKRVAETYKARVRILCWVPSMATHWTSKLKAVNETWARRCGKILYFISFPRNTSHDVIGLQIPDNRQTLTDKTVYIHRYLYDNFLEQYDWFLKADDDTYVIMENLRFLLSHFDPNIPGYIGCQFKHFSPQGYMSGGAGYAFSRQGLKQLVEKGYNVPARCRLKGGAEDIETGRCAYKAGVRILNSLDIYKKPTFFPANIYATVLGLPDWAKHYMRDDVRVGVECCSQLLVAFHYTGPKLMYAIDFLLYRLSVHGRRFMQEKEKQFFDGEDVKNMDRAVRRRAYPGEDLDQYYKDGWREQNTTIYINRNLLNV